ncbi:MAG: hypothetical protein A3D27_03000 [Omnitrophica WOR_2 bacterium RIFCSPHIGHO2_02_FULL_46_37]|nr:MAG: hypothetical protein A3D27_03000 [Omnitrophica WOR_2 bacterium RIFCSPHIGHO2_02_FULL_46_37]OGX42448.1 MAG: hypothetical protein A3H41_03420 [Omnitrophica WOR_2 bacterium RIFCSPLOWO2_02_FULL_45_28]
MLKKILCFSLVFILLGIQGYPLYGYNEIPQYLCEYGRQFFQAGMYEEALFEFRKALLIQSDYEPALRYIRLLEQIKTEGVSAQSRLEKEVIVSRELERFEKKISSAASGTAAIPEAKKKGLPAVLGIDEYARDIAQPLEIPEGESLILAGRNIRKFLVTQPEIITVERKGPDELMVTGKDIGYVSLHIWDDKGRRTVEFLGVFPRLIGEEALLRDMEKAGNFKLRYTLDWSTFETGSNVQNFRRTSYFLKHGIGLEGDTPYGKFDSFAVLSRLRKSADFTYYTLGLSGGQLGRFKGFSLRGFDFNPPFSNLAFSGAALRGIQLQSPVSNNKLDYTVFSGRERGGVIGALSADSAKEQDSFIEGVNLNYAPLKNQSYKLTLLHGYGSDRLSTLHPFAYDFIGRINFKPINFVYEIANDTERFAHLFKTTLRQPKFNLSAEFRDIDKNFTTIRGTASRQGEIGTLLNLNYAPTQKLGIQSSLDIYQDSLNPAKDNDTRLNEDFSWDANYRLEPQTYLRLSYALQNQLGRLAQFRYQSFGSGIYRKFKFIKDIDTYLNYYHQENKNFSSPASDYLNEKITLGLRFRLLGDLYYYFNKDINWFEERFNGAHTMPHAYETGLDWSSPIGLSPLAGVFRFSFRDEEDTVSNLSFFSGEDYIENYLELAYRPREGMELYASCRFRNIWAENPRVNARMEATFNAGMRYLWDTGIRWEAIGAIEGYVFNDYNQNGLKEAYEPGMPEVKLWLGKAKFINTDASGYYKFSKVKARKASVSIDSKTIPPGYILTFGPTQEVKMAHGQLSRVDFGLTNHSEISGIVFEDIDGNGKVGQKESGVKGVIITLEDGTKAVTDDSGRYFFRKAEAGKHMVTLDINSLPAAYFPAVPLYKEIELGEGMSFKYDIPLKKAEK